MKSSASLKTFLNSNELTCQYRFCHPSDSMISFRKTLDPACSTRWMEVCIGILYFYETLCFILLFVHLKLNTTMAFNVCNRRRDQRSHQHSSLENDVTMSSHHHTSHQSDSRFQKPTEWRCRRRRGLFRLQLVQKTVAQGTREAQNKQSATQHLSQMIHKIPESQLL